MTKNPILNALAAALYIAVVGSVMYYGPKSIDSNPTVLVPIAILSLLCLSVACMAYVFFYNPVLMYIEGQKVNAIKLGLQTLGAFAVITMIFLAALFSSAFF